MREIILHIGAHKTGSTSIQGFLNRNKASLAERSWKLISIDGALNLANLISIEDPGKGEIKYCFKDNALERLENKLKAAEQNCVISAEDFFFINDLQSIESLKSLLTRYFDKITVLVYLRRQDQMAISQKAQGAKTIQSAKIFGNSPFPLPEINKKVLEYLDYNKKLDSWVDCFGEENLIVRIFERARLHKGDAVTDFIATSGIPVSPEPITLNESLGVNPTLFLHLLRYSGVPHTVIWPLLKSRRIETPPGERLLPSRDEALAFQANFGKSNGKLFERFKLGERFDQNFDNYPLQASLTALEPDFAERNLQFMVTILQGVANDRSRELFEYAATVLTESDPEVAEALVILADRQAAISRELGILHPGPAAGAQAIEEEKPSLGEGRRIREYVEKVIQLGKVANDDNVNLFIRAADKLEPTDQESAEKFMLLAHSIRPYGPYIKSQLAKYKQQRDERDRALQEMSFRSRSRRLLKRCRVAAVSLLKGVRP